jgi:hypothetical protein
MSILLIPANKWTADSNWQRPKGLFASFRIYFKYLPKSSDGELNIKEPRVSLRIFPGRRGIGYLELPDLKSRAPINSHL